MKNLFLGKCKINVFEITVIAFITSFILFFLVPLILIEKKLEIFNFLPDFPSLLIDFYWTISLAIDHEVIAYSPLTDILFRLPNGIPTLILFPIYIGVIFGSIFFYYFKVLPARNVHFTSTTLIFFLGLLFSYGLCFEIIWGQWNVISFFLVLFAVFLFKERFKFIGYLLFALAVHLKIYNFIFILLFIDDLRCFRVWFKDLLIITLLIFMFFFTQGYQELVRYVENMIEYSNNPPVWAANHSIFSFSKILVNEGFDNIGLYIYISYFLILISTLIIMFIKKIKGFSGDLLMILVVGSLIIPSLSMDYKLPLLFISMPLYIQKYKDDNDAIDLLLLFGIIILLFSTMYSYKNYEVILRNMMFNCKFLQLYIILILVFVKFVYANSKEIVTQQ